MEDIFMKSEIKQRMFFKDLSSKSLANSNLINSKMLNNVVADCGLYVNPNAVKFFRIALSNFEKVLLRNGLDVNEFSVYDFAQTDYGKNLEHYISNYVPVIYGFGAVLQVGHY